jgi:hypothetical protein
MIRIEHLLPSQLSDFRLALFSSYRSPLIVITTPNAEYNSLFPSMDEQFRDPDHRLALVSVDASSTADTADTE